MLNQLVIEDWDGDGTIRLPNDVLQEMGIDVGDTLYLVEEYVGTDRYIVLSKTPRTQDRVDEPVDHWDSSDKGSTEMEARDK